MNDEGFREIQLNGKQLVFLVMAATVVSVVIFLTGVLVGRNSQHGSETVDVAATDIAPDPGVPPVAENIAPAPSGGSPSPDTPAAKPEQLSYADRLLREGTPEENLKPAATKPAASKPTPAQAVPPHEPPPSPAPTVKEPVAATPPPPRPAPATPPPAPAEAAAPVATAQSSDTSGPGFAVQVSAVKDRQEADTLVKQLIAKGYPAFVLDPVKGAPTAFFRVRVGKYKTRQEAQAIMVKLQSVEQFSTAWIAR